MSESGWAVLAVVVAVGLAAACVGSWRAGLRLRAGRELGVRVPRAVRVRRGRDDVRPGRLSLGIPCWEHAKADGTRDLRTSGLAIVRPASVVRVGRWVLACGDPFSAYRLACALRDAGTDVAPCEQELAKLSRLATEAELRRGARNVDELVARFRDRPTEFEGFCAELFRALGYEVTVTPPTGDGGYDLLIVDPATGEGSIAECKCYARGRSVGRPLVQKLVGANDAVGAAGMLFLTTSAYSAGAREYAGQVGVTLVDGPGILALCERAWGEGRAPRPTERDARLTPAEIRLLFPPDM